MAEISYSNFIRTLSEISFDSAKRKGENSVNNKQVKMLVSSSRKESIDFDRFMEEYFKSFHNDAKKPDSVDAFCYLDDVPCLIEFKNGRIKYQDIGNKLGSSVITIIMKDNIMPTEFKQKSIFILVYNKERAFKKYTKESYLNFNEQLYLLSNQLNHYDSFDEIANYISMRNLKRPVIHFGLKAFEGIYFSKVYTMDKDIFDKFIELHNVTLPK